MSFVFIVHRDWIEAWGCCQPEFRNFLWCVWFQARSNEFANCFKVFAMSVALCAHAFRFLLSRNWHSTFFLYYRAAFVAKTFSFARTSTQPIFRLKWKSNADASAIRSRTKSPSINWSSSFRLSWQMNFTWTMSRALVGGIRCIAKFRLSFSTMNGMDIAVQRAFLCCLVSHRRLINKSREREREKERGRVLCLLYFLEQSGKISCG